MWITVHDRTTKCIVSVSPSKLNTQNFRYDACYANPESQRHVNVKSENEKAQNTRRGIDDLKFKTFVGVLALGVSSREPEI